MNIYDIAEKAGVSIATVSRVLNSSSHVKEKTRAKVLAVIEELGYTPNIFARGLGLNSIKMVGLLCTDVSDIFYAKAVSIIENSLRQYGYDSILSCTGNSLESKKKCLQLILDKRVDGIILIGSSFKEKNDNSHIENAAKIVPVVIINGLIESPNTYCVLCDEESAVFDNVNSLIKSGSKDILFLYRSETYSAMKKLSGYKKAFEENNLPIDSSYILRVPESLDSIQEVINELLNQNKKITAVVSDTDYLSAIALKVLQLKGFKVPRDVKVIGFDNSFLCDLTIPSLSSVDNMLENLCLTSTSILSDVFTGKIVPNKTILSAKMIKRESF